MQRGLGGRFEFQRNNRFAGNAPLQHHLWKRAPNSGTFLALCCGFAATVPHEGHAKEEEFAPRKPSAVTAYASPTMYTNSSRKSRWNPFRRHIMGSVAEETTPIAPPLAPPKSKTFETNVERVESWPEEARPLKKHTWLSYLYGVGDLILVVLPVYFILLGVAAITLNGKPTKGSEFGKKVEFAMTLGPTMFPILFAAISGRSMKMIARFLAEKGTKISTLEQLMASQSVWGTFEIQMNMQRLTLVGINLLFLWALSPLGGQASLRLMGRQDRDSFVDTQLRYMTTGPGGSMWGLSSTYSGSGKYADAGALYTAALLAPLDTKTGPRDLWGNVKIPNLEYINETKSDAEGWFTVPTIEHPETYSALVGLPIVGLPTTTKSNFTLESTYLTVECSRFNQTPYPGINDTNRSDTDFAKLDQLVPGQVWLNKSLNNPFEPSAGLTTSFFIDTNLETSWAETSPSFEPLRGRLDSFFGYYNQSRLNNTLAQEKRKLIYASIYATSADEPRFGLNVAYCTIAQNHVEAMIECNGTQCAATKVRKSLTDTRPSKYTPLEHGTIMIGFAEQFPIAVTFNTGSSPTERYLTNSSSFPFIQEAGQLSLDVVYANVSLVEPELFSRRLSSAINTYYQLTIQPTGYFGSLPRNLSLYGPDTLPVTDINKYLPGNLSATNTSFFDWWSEFDRRVQTSDSPFIGATTAAETTTTEQIFVGSAAWISLLIVSSVVIFIIGFTAMILKRHTLGPEMFGFVTSMTYENPWVKIPQGGTMLDAMERARLLRDVEVHVADVRGDDNVGHIAFAAGTPLRKLERGRLYR
ncbi:ATP binding [Pyrenophora seminiperda CCB06]|uniref:ATP binding n=1 Tax=Pyrenophora seminiperda CCB06 TaxID=1302712 RepID=A0A3M7MCT8_9PLEO|nr:ATP binding [Pyrenophora seminiperda CCB06]